MSRSAGTGSPLNFRCAACRRRHPSWIADHWAANRGYEVKLTGKSKKRHRASVRHGSICYQYKCLDCGHVGYSAHNDLAAMVKSREKFAQLKEHIVIEGNELYCRECQEGENLGVVSERVFYQAADRFHDEHGSCGSG